MFISVIFRASHIWIAHQSVVRSSGATHERSVDLVLEGYALAHQCDVAPAGLRVVSSPLPPVTSWKRISRDSEVV